MKNTISPATPILCIIACVLLGGCATQLEREREVTRITKNPQQAEINWVLDSLHDAAAKANEPRYFAFYAPNAVFLGTDAKERWTLDEFRAFAHPYFAKGKAWTYVPIPGSRHVVIEGQGQDVAWFDEQLQNAKLGVCRGSGVLVKVGGDWRVKQYNLTMLVPNEIAEKVATESQEELKRQAAQPK